jgi:hypothetical protein
MKRKCDRVGCPNVYEYQRRSSRFCSTACRSANAGKPKPVKRRVKDAMFVPDDPDHDPVEILRERRAAKRLPGGESNEAYARAMAKWNALPWSVRDPRGVNPDNPVNWLS